MSRTLFSTLLLWIATSAFAQISTPGKTIITDNNVEINGYSAPAYTVYFEGKQSGLTKAWAGFLKDTYGLKQRRSGAMYSTEMVSMPDISANKIILYTFIYEDGSQPAISLAAAFSGDSFIDPKENSIEADKIKMLFKRFVKAYQLQLVNEELETIQKSYDKMAGDLSKIDKEKASLNKDRSKLEKKVFKNDANINKMRNEILELEAKINKLSTDNAGLKSEIDDLKSKTASTDNDATSQKNVLDVQKQKLDVLNARKTLIINE